MAIQVWRHIPGKGLMFLLNLFTAIALIFEGYNQGVFGTVSETPGFIEMSKIGVNGKVTDSTKQGGLAAAYYFGAMWGCFIGGKLDINTAVKSSLTICKAGSVTNLDVRRAFGWDQCSALPVQV